MIDRDIAVMHLEAGRNDFYSYMRMQYPRFFTKDKPHLRSLCDTLQAFIEDKLIGADGQPVRNLILNIPPRHGKTLSVIGLVQWELGRDPLQSYACVSYNEKLSGRFARGVRDAMQEVKAGPRLVYGDYFPGTRVKVGDGGYETWSVEGSPFSFLATSPGGTLTGIGCTRGIIDDIVKSSDEAFNENVLEGHWDWYCFTGDTMVSTPFGDKPISNIGIGDKILTYNHSQCSIEVGTVSRIANRESEIYELRFNNGTEIKCTGNHEFFTNHGYKSVEEVLRSMRKALAPGETVLLPQLQVEISREKTSKNSMLELSKRNKHGETEQAEDVLFFGMPNRVQAEDCRSEASDVEQNQGRAEIEIQNVPRVRFNEKTGSASYRQGYKEQRTCKPEGSLPLVPYGMSQATRNAQKEQVYDITVCGNHNFFANGILVHNCNTFLSRLEAGAKQLIIMTRWATADLCGKLLEREPEKWHVILMPANKTGVETPMDADMLCPAVLDAATYIERREKTDPVIHAANYDQKPYDSTDKLYPALKTYRIEDAPKFSKINNYTDTADEGSDYLCSISYGVASGLAYVLDVVYTQDSMEKTEPETARVLTERKVQRAYVESNNGGRGFARAVEKLLRANGNSGIMVEWFHQSENKAARILSNAVAVSNCVLFPEGWQYRWPKFYEDVTRLSRSGKWAHDDAPDALTGIVEKSLSRPAFAIL